MAMSLKTYPAVVRHVHADKGYAAVAFYNDARKWQVVPVELFRFTEKPWKTQLGWVTYVVHPEGNYYVWLDYADGI